MFDSWFNCQGDNSYWDRILGCTPSGILDQQGQVDAMRGNFGGHADPKLVDKAVNDWDRWLTDTHYQQTVDSLLEDDVRLLPKFPKFPQIDLMSLGLVAIGVVGVVVLLGDRGARRYGR